MKKKYLGLKQQFLLLSLCSGSLMAAPAHGGPTIPGFIGNTADVLPSIPATALPTGGTIIQGIDSIRNLSASQMEITQNAPKAVIHWQTFNIGKDASVNFNQQGNSGWAALNAIGDASPSQIHGKMTADGQIYLINRNGILFGPSAQVNVHSLTASSLKLTYSPTEIDLNNSNEIDTPYKSITISVNKAFPDNEELTNTEQDELEAKKTELINSASAFVNGYSTKDKTSSTFSFLNSEGGPSGPVQNRGTITAASGGQVTLIGGSVLNSGTITTSQGIISLAAGDSVTIKTSTSSLYPDITTTGNTAEVINHVASESEQALIKVESGRIGLYGGIVNQNGRAIATTAVLRSGMIELKGSNRVSTGVNSLTATPVSTSTERQTPSETTTPGGVITVQSKEFIHQGAISSPGGKLTVNTTTNPAERIQLAPGSTIDVSGMWVDQEASDRILTVQLNSDILKNAYALKNGPLQGETVAVDILNGLKAADISDYLEKRVRSAAEQLINGGTIELNAKNVELAPESRVVFSGGGYNFSPGSLEFTKVRVGNKIYELSELPAGTPVDEVLGSFTRSHDRYGRSQTWVGSYYGGSMPVAESSPAFRWGGDAGTLSINAAYVYMAGILDGWAERGIYQTDTKDRLYADGDFLALGRRMPTGGTLRVGSATTNTSYTSKSATEATPSTYAISITPEVTVLDERDSGNKLSTIPTSVINNTGLSVLNLAAKTTFNIDEGVDLQLVPGGSFSASARQVTVNGSIQVAGGSINLVTASNKSSFSSITGKENTNYIPLDERLTIASTSVLNTAGEEIINTGLQNQRSGFTNGGSITIMNMSASQDGTIIMENPDHGYDLTIPKGSQLSVQGGYSINSKGTMESGDAGSIVIRQRINEQSTDSFPEELALTVDGELLGSAFLGGNGGSLTIDACRMAVLPADSAPFSANGFLDIPGAFILADNRFSRTGLSTINLSSYDDLTIASGSLLQPSLSRLVKSDSLLSTSSSPMTVLPIEAGDTAIHLSTLRGDVIVENGSSIEVAPEGEIELSAGALASISGNLGAPGGTVTITGQNITAMGTAKISAAGVNLLNNETIGPWDDASWKVLNGGTVSLNATTGSLTLEAGSQIDVSGSDVVINTVEDSLGNLVHRNEAGSPGSIEFSFLDTLTLNGTLIADSFLPGLAGGTLNITRSNDLKSFAVGKTLAEALLIEGFDDLQLGSAYGIEFSESLSLSSGRRFVLNTPRIIGTEGAVSVQAPWVQLINKQGKYVSGSNPTAEESDPSFTVSADSLDIKGNIQVSGFAETILRSENAIRLSDVFYNKMATTKFDGRLDTAGDLTLHAQVIYPTTGSIFEVKGSGLVSILPQEEQYASPVYSAVGSLTITGKDIYHAGYLAVPMGELTLKADSGRILLAPNSRLSVSGETEITYGMVVDSLWKAPNHETDKGTTPTEGMTVPEPSITVSGHEVIISDGSRIEADGGGTLVAREFLAGYDGTTNPLDLELKNRLVIIPDSSFVLPTDEGQIFIDDYAPLGLAAGVYSILPAEYAFLPGAIILERTSTEAFSGQNTFNLLEQPIIAGYETPYGFKAVPAAMTGYVVRSAADVLKEGQFDKQVQTMADGGNITVDGDTASILGSVTATAADGGKNGGLTIYGTNIKYQPIPTILEAGNVYFDNRLISNETKLGRLTLVGNDDNKDTSTGTVTFADGMSFSGIPLVEIKAEKSIIIGADAEIHALTTDTEEGKISLTTSNLTTETGSLLHASNELAFNVTGAWDFKGNWQVDDGRIRLFSDLISIGSSPDLDLPEVDNGMFMTQTMLNAFTHVGELMIDSDTDIRFLDSINLTTGGSLLFDCQRLLYSSSSDSESKVTINADNLRLENSKSSLGTSVPNGTEDLNHHLNLNAQSSFILGPGSVHIDGFSDVDFTANGNMLFEGKGGLQVNLPEAGALAMTAAGFFASYPNINDDEVLGANTFAISSSKGDIHLIKGGFTSTTGAPGSFSVTSRSITLDGALLDFPGGRVELTATGTEATDNITLKNGAAIKAQGGIRLYDLILPDETAIMSFQLAGGEVLLSAASGGIVFGDEDDTAGANIIDVSATDGMNGGWLTLNTPSACLDFSRTSLRGSGGDGGSFDLTTKYLPELGNLVDTLTTGGFTNGVRIQVREGDINLAADKTLTARSILLAADGENDPSETKGKVTIKGSIKASGKTGGEIAVYSKQDLILADGGLIEARGVTGAGGKVTLGSENGFVETEASSTIDVTGASGTGGIVIYRVDATEHMSGPNTIYDGAKLNAAGVVAGAGDKRLQAVKNYDFGTSIDNNEKNKLITASSGIVTTLAANSNYSTYTLIPEFEITSTDDLLLPSTLMFTGLENWRPGRLPNDEPAKTDDDLPGVLTFRAAGNLKVETSVVDSPTLPNLYGIRDIQSDGKIDSWSLNFAAGADLGAADPMNTLSAKDLTIGTTINNNIVVFTESGNINMAAGQNIIIKPANNINDFMPGVKTYTVATFDGDITGYSGQDLDLRNGGVMQSATGNINLETGRDILLANKTGSDVTGGAIRTTGRVPTWTESGNKEYLEKLFPGDSEFLDFLRMEQFWLYQDGGNISARVYGDIAGKLENGVGVSRGWENAYVTPETLLEDLSSYRWSANYGATSFGNQYGDATASHGIVTMGGGNVSINAGDDFLAQTGTFSTITSGDLSITTKGELNGRFIAMSGDAFLSTLGNFGISTYGTPPKDFHTVISMGDTNLTVQAMGSTEIGSICNPSIANAFSTINTFTQLISQLTYTSDSSVQLTAVLGDTILSGQNAYATSAEDLGMYNLLPGTLNIKAGQDIFFTTTNTFVMAPVVQGNLILLAGHDLKGTLNEKSAPEKNEFTSFIMSDSSLDVYTTQTNNTDSLVNSIAKEHSGEALHTNDNAPIMIKAGNDIANINSTLAKQAEIIAGHDISNIIYSGQHISEDDYSQIVALHDVDLSKVVGLDKTDEDHPFKGITQAGPGSLLILTGNNLNLANSHGIQSIGNLVNSTLRDDSIPLSESGRVKGSDITIISGYSVRPTTEETSEFLAKLKTDIKEISAFIAAANDNDAAHLKETIRTQLFAPFLYDYRSGTGDLNMTSSSIQALSGEESINIFAAGNVNVGVTRIETDTPDEDAKETGIFTAGGGSINILAGKDINVNESRIMTFLGGDMVIVSDNGNVYAGRGSKAKVTSSKGSIVEDSNGMRMYVSTPPITGSGLRTLAYDPDGTGPYVTPEPGDMYVVAWDGLVDAGEAGIEGGNLYLAAAKVLNAQNISVGAGSVGMPASSGAVASLGALTGDSMSATESTTSSIAESTTAGAGEKMAETAKKIADTISQLRFFVVKFLGFME